MAEEVLIGIVYSETTANQYYYKTAYAQVFMAAQNQAAMAGVPFDVLTEDDLTNLATLSKYDALIFPNFANVQASELDAIENTLELAVQQYQISLIAAGNFMTNDETGAAFPGDAYARMKSLLGVRPLADGFPDDVSLDAGDITHPVMLDYSRNEHIRTYDDVQWFAFKPVNADSTAVLATQTIDGQTYKAAMVTTTAGSNVHFSTEEVMIDSNLLWQAIDYLVNGSGITVGLQLSRQTSIVASRVDMDQAMNIFAVNPEDGSAGVYDLLLPILEQWKATYNFVGSYYIDIGDDAGADQITDWSVSGPYYEQLLAMGNELGSHSISHPFFTNSLTAEEIEYEFQGSRQIIEEQMSQFLGRPFTIEGAAVPGNPETEVTAAAILQYYDYLSGGFSSTGAGFAGALGYLNPAMAALGKVYLAPNVQFDSSLIAFQGMTAEQAAAQWMAEWVALTNHAEVPVLVWPWHDYGASTFPTDPPADSPYTTAMYTDFIARAYDAGSEFVRLDDLAQRIAHFDDSALDWTILGNTVTATVTSPNAGKFALDLDNLGSQKIARVTDWYAYDDDSVFLPIGGGTYPIVVGAAADDLTHIVKLPMRSELISLTGDGIDLSFSLFGEGRMVIDLADPAGREAVVTGATIVSLEGDILTLDVGTVGQHDVSVTLDDVAGLTLIGDSGDNTLTGGAGGDSIYGMGGNDVLDGAGGDDILEGGPGSDTTNGGLGIDLHFVDDPYDVVIEGPGGGSADRVYASVNYTLGAGVEVEIMKTRFDEGTDPINLTGNELANFMVGNDGDNELVGLGGADTMRGALGNDLYFFDDPYDVAIEGPGGGSADRVYASVSYALGAGVEVEIMKTRFDEGTDPINLTGNEFANYIYGNDGDNELVGLGGVDTIRGGLGNDLYFFDDWYDVAIEGPGGGSADRVYSTVSYALGAGVEVEIMKTRFDDGTDPINLTGNEFANYIYGNDGDNELVGLGGVDTIRGGLGNDLYFFDDWYDVAIEGPGGGSADRVYSTVSYALGAGVEVEIMKTRFDEGTDPINLTGNEFANYIYGNDGDNELVGLGGVDTIRGGLGNDLYFFDDWYDVAIEGPGGGSADRVYSTVSYALGAGVEVEIMKTRFDEGTDPINLTGNEFANYIYGNDGDNELVGLGGVDTIRGGLGNDLYFFDDPHDVAIEGPGGGSADRVYSTVSYALGAGVEVEIMKTRFDEGTDPINLTGNELANSILGNEGDNILNGRAGNDGLWGGAGADRFVFDTALNAASNVDQITDFTPSDDVLLLDDVIFAGLTPGPLAPGAFRVGSAAQDADDRITYNLASGALMFDGDGSGAAAALPWAILSANLALTIDNFLVV